MTELSFVGTQLLTRKEVAKMLNVCAETVKRWARHGDLPTHRLNSRTVRYAPADVQKLIDQSRGVAPAVTTFPKAAAV